VVLLLSLVVLVLSLLSFNESVFLSLCIRISPSLVVIHSTYSIYHLSRHVATRPPASSAAYQLFSAGFDLAISGVYIYLAADLKRSGLRWKIHIAGDKVRHGLLLSIFWCLIISTILHCCASTMSTWLAWQFKLISHIPPDMNPLFETPRHEDDVALHPGTTQSTSDDLYSVDTTAGYRGAA
jgi:hypothetical protein